MIQGYIDAYRAFGNELYIETALKNANFLIANQLRKDGGLNRNFKDGRSNINAYSEDYAATIQAFISLYEVTLDEKWLKVSKELMDYLTRYFFDENNRMFHFTSKNDENLIVRKFELIDGVIPASNSVLANCLFKLGHYYTDAKYVNFSEQMLNNVKDQLLKSPGNYSNWLNLMVNFTNPFYEVVLAGKSAQTLNKILQRTYLPNTLIAGTTEENNRMPLLAYKYNDTETLIYICVNGTCKKPQRDLNKAIETIEK
jgi:hypothetical protein